MLCRWGNRSVLPVPRPSQCSCPLLQPRTSVWTDVHLGKGKVLVEEYFSLDFIFPLFFLSFLFLFLISLLFFPLLLRLLIPRTIFPLTLYFLLDPHLINYILRVSHFPFSLFTHRLYLDLLCPSGDG